ncbi:MAG: metallophosphoesterase [Desulfurococcaceae archaeon]
MIIGVISDSHDNIYALKKVIERLLKHGVKSVIHLGDIISPFSVKLLKDELKEIPVIAVRGNNDGDIYQLTAMFTRYGWVFKPDPGIIEIDQRKILLLHGYGGTNDTLTFVNSLAKSLNVDFVLYGHTHKPVIEEINGKIILNPGEVCGYLTGKTSYAILDLEKNKAEIHFLEEGV